jgi:putative transposase
MKYNPKQHHRRSIRLKNYDYSQVGAYFITPCVEAGNHLFGEIEENEMICNAFGQIAYNTWDNITTNFENIELDAFVVMPNHTHHILIINSDDNIKTLGEIVGAYKSLVVHNCLNYIKENDLDIQLGKVWQRNYWEHIIRDERSYDYISDYIVNNPMNWDKDKLRKP